MKSIKPSPILLAILLVSLAWGSYGSYINKSGSGGSSGPAIEGNPLFDVPYIAPPVAGWTSQALEAATTIGTGPVLGERTMYVTAAGGLQSEYRAIGIGAPWTLTACINMTGTVAADSVQYANIFVQDTAGSIVSMKVGWDTAAAVGLFGTDKWTDAATFSANYTLTSSFRVLRVANIMPLWLRVTDDGVNLTWLYSNNGRNFVQADQRARLDFLIDITNVGWGASPSTLTTQSYVSLLSWEVN